MSVLIDMLLDRLFERHEIASRGDLYMVRWVVAGQRYGPGGKLFVHKFLRSDNEEALHDHPWPFRSLILAGGYYEETDNDTMCYGNLPHAFHGFTRCGRCGTHRRKRRWYAPGRVLTRPAGFRHRVVLRPGTSAYTLVWTGPKCRSWYFHCPAGPVHWRDFLGAVKAGRSGCS